MMRAATLVLGWVLVGCGPSGATDAPDPDPGAATAGGEATASVSRCPFTVADVERAPLGGPTGMRLRVRVPDGFVPLIGVPALAHPCGAVIGFSETPPGPPQAERQSFHAGVISGAIGAADEAQQTCVEGADQTWRCHRANGFVGLRAVDEGGVLGVVQVHGLVDATLVDALLASAGADPSAAWDPIAPMSIALAPIPGLTLDDLSSPPIFQYALAGSAEPDAPAVHWTFIPYATHPEHADGSPWTGRELGRECGARARTELGLDGLDVDTIEGGALRQTELGEDADFRALGTAGGRPVAIYGAYLREHLGFFAILARAPAREATTWLPRFREHVRSYRAAE